MGCIPVFIGPPYHAMPFEKEIDYVSSALFINVTNSSSWLGDMVMEPSLPVIPRVSPFLLMDNIFSRSGESRADHGMGRARGVGGGVGGKL
jgi:hypothetical protein